MMNKGIVIKTANSTLYSVLLCMVLLLFAL